MILLLAATTLGFKSRLDELPMVAAVSVCLAWIQVIFLFGRYPFLGEQDVNMYLGVAYDKHLSFVGGRFSIMYYSITKRIIKTVLGFAILIIAFAFAFFIISFGNEDPENPFSSVEQAALKIFVMVLGEFEFDDLWNSSVSSKSPLTLVFSMILLVGLIILGSLIMVNLIVAIIISDIDWLNKTSEDQALLNQAHHAVTFHALQNLLGFLLPFNRAEK